MASICGINCAQCGFREKCGGCDKTSGNPFGGKCVTAQYIIAGGKEQYETFKAQLIEEFNALGVPGMPPITDLIPLAGFYVNLSYPLPSGECQKLLRDDRIYLGTQVTSLFDDGSPDTRAFGLIADTQFLLVSEYGPEGTLPEIVVFKRR